MLTRMSSARLQCFLDDGKPNANGFLQTYALGTTTPKNTYYDIYGIAPQSNPIKLDSAGTAPVYLFGSYTIWEYDSTSAQVGAPVDIEAGLNDSIITSGSGGFANNQFLLVNTYADVRAITNEYALVYVQGRVNQADGGEGLFYLDQSSTDSDDDGITLTPNVTGRYIRFNVETIDPRWFGLVYNTSIDQGIYLTKSAQASQRYAKDVEIDGSTYLNQNYTTSAYNSTWRFTSNAKMVSTAGITFTFTSNTFLIECGSKVFGNTVQPIFQTGVTETIKYSWMDASNDEGRVTKFLSASSVPNVLEMDKQANINLDFVMNPNLTLYIPNGSTSGTININGTSKNVTIPNITNSSSKNSAIKFQNISTIGNINVPANLSPEFFGAFGNGVSADDIPLFASLKSGNFNLVNKYLVTSSTLTIPNQVTINGLGNLLIGTSAEDITNISTIPLQSIILNSVSGVSGVSAASITFGNVVQISNANIIGTSANTFSGSSAIYFNNTFVQIPNIGLFPQVSLENSDIIGNISTNNSFIDSSIILGNISNVNSLSKSTISNFSGNILGNVYTSTISATNTMGIYNNISINDSSIVKNNILDTTSATLLGFFGNSLIFSNTNIENNGSILYSITSSQNITFNSCNNSQNFNFGISNGFANIIMNNCNVFNNSTISLNNGINQIPTINVTPGVSGFLATSSTAFWNGVGSLGTDGTNIILGTSANLDTTPWTSGTIRWLGNYGDQARIFNQAENAQLQSLYHFGGQIRTTVTYPAGVAPDPRTKLIVAFCYGKINANGNSACPPWQLSGPENQAATGHNIMGRNSPVSLPATNGAILKTNTNVWGGQLDLYTWSDGPNHHMVDEWGDVNYFLPNVLRILDIPRIIIYNAGTGILPTGTKINIIVDPALPTTDQYKYFWPLTGWGMTVGYQSLYVTSQRKYSDLFSNMAFPYQFRQCDSDGLQMAYSRNPGQTATSADGYPYGSISTAAITLPQTSWFDSTTLHSNNL